MTSFHCLEHVENPVEFVRSLAHILRYGPERPVGKGKLFLDLLCHLPAVARLYGRQRRREQENGGVAADASLVRPSRVAREFADRELEHLGGVGHQNVYRKP